MTALEEIKKALAAAEQFIVNGVELGYIRMPDPETPDSAHDTLPMIRQAQTALESLQRENAALKRDRYDLAYAITGGEDAPGLLDTVPTSELVEIARDNHRSHSSNIDRAMAAEAEVKRMRDRYERWMPVTEKPPSGTHPDALLHFYCISDEVDGDESPEYWMTDTWQDKPADAVYWCAIVSPIGPHERTFIARTALASTGGEHNAE